MCKIGILFLDRDFEHDVYELTKAFYPEGEIVRLYEAEEPGEAYDVFFRIERREDSYEIRYKTEERSGASSVALTEGHSGPDKQDALFDCKREERKLNKDHIKKLLYHILKKLTGRTLPWGNLTGIRPAKLAMGMIEEGMKNTEVAKAMRENYEVSPQKAALAVAIANREKAILEKLDYEKGYSLYVGIPFCPSICLYCSFSSYPLKQWKKRVDGYLDALCKEIRAVAPMMKHKKLDTIYIGGGTPTTLEAEQLTRLLQCIGESFGYEGVVEFTVEAGRPDSITREKLLAVREFPVTRISVNPQTMNQVTLDIIGRRHSVEDTKNAFLLARELGYDIMDMTMQTACEMGMGPYYLYRQKNMKGNFENVGYAKVDKAGIYNILIMEEKQPIIALGAGGSSKLVFDGGNRIERVENVKDVENYITRIDEMIERKRAGIAAWL